MKKRMSAWIAAVTAAVLVCLTGPAQATTIWVPASCATGSFGTVTVDELGHYLTPARMALCEPYQPRFNYEIVIFFPDSSIPFAYGTNLRSYPPAGPVEVIADFLPKSPTPLFGLCLMRDVDTRVACVRIDTTADGVATSTPIAVDDSLVAAQVLFSRMPPVISPQYCATCVTVQPS
jgi:hypothetical protein